MQILTANRLDDGAVVYLAPDGQWREAPGQALIVSGPDAAKAAEAAGLQAEAARLVVGSYLMDVVADAGAPRPKSMRERIRAAGPSVRLDLGKQAA